MYFSLVFPRSWDSFFGLIYVVNSYYLLCLVIVVFSCKWTASVRSEHMLIEWIKMTHECLDVPLNIYLLSDCSPAKLGEQLKCMYRIIVHEYLYYFTIKIVPGLCSLSGSSSTERFLSGQLRPKVLWLELWGENTQLCCVRAGSRVGQAFLDWRTPSMRGWALGWSIVVLV